MSLPESQARATGLFPFSLLAAIWGTMGFAGYYPEILRPYLPDWLAVGLLVLPVTIILFIQRGEVSDKRVTRAHLFAASLFLALAAGMEVGVLLGHRPKGLALYRVLAHLAWTFSWAGIARAALADARRKQ